MHVENTDVTLRPEPSTTAGSLTTSSAISNAGTATHNTTGGYVDDISITISPRSSAGVDAVTAVAFSSSGIGGAYCDSGQNYKQILMLFEAIQAAWTLEHMDGSCSGGDIEWS